MGGGEQRGIDSLAFPESGTEGYPSSTIVGSGGGRGLSRLSLESKEWGEGLAEVFGLRMEPGVLTGIGGDAVSYPPLDFWGPAYESLRSRRAVDDVCLGRILHLPSIPPRPPPRPL